MASFPEPQPAYYCSEEPFGRSEEERALSSEGQRSPGSPSAPSSQPGGNSTNMSDLPSFTPSVFPPSAFNYERPRHFIQSQAAFQAPSYESVLKEAHENQTTLNRTSSAPNMLQRHRAKPKRCLPKSVSKSMSQTQAQFQSLSLSQNQTQSVAQTQAQTQVHTHAQAQLQSKTEAHTQAVMQTQTHTQAQTQVHTQAQAQLQSKTEAHTQALMQTQTHTQAQTQVHTQAQAQLQSKTEAHTQAVMQTQTHTQAQTQVHTQAQAQAKVHTQAQVHSHAQAQLQIQTEAHTHSQALMQTQTHTQAQAQVHTQVHSQAQAQAQVQIQSQANGTSNPHAQSVCASSSSPFPPPPSSPFPASSAPFPPPPSSPFPPSLPRTTMRSTITLTPSIPSATGLGSATLPANQDSMSAPVAFLCSVLPSPSAFSPFSSSKLSPNSSLPHPSISPSRSPLSPFPSPLPQQHLPVTFPPSLPLSPPPPHLSRNPHTPNGQSRVPPLLPKPILKKAVAPRPSSSRSTDDDIQGSKDALIQDLEKKLRSKEARRRGSQKLSYEERMARRLLGPDNANYMFDQDGLSDSQLDQIPQDLTVEEGRFCRIDFKVGGLPTPDVCWYLDGKAIRPDDYHKMLVCEKGMHSFIIEIVTVHHAGVYECEARNRAGESRFTMRLDVLAQEALRPPTFVQKMLNSRVLEGDTVRLECKVDASPPPQLHWKKDKDMLRIDPNRMSLYEDGSGRQCLLIERLMKSDAGWYTLSAINEAGMSTCNARLDVGTRTAPKTAPPGSKTLKLLSSLKHVPSLTVETPTQHTAPLYESEEL
ncbi:hypothetical protein F7725_009728 [Dissostichus mawsoni]|uniref:Ig-like domain-containing protein n=1 Tax=Dissostichus mawsoni TaxID=36200 RepID=A0A7J5XLT1_DISMA|nr:hypothetical protein F7725_009728 [Dissostichus mawsoni]